MIVRNNSFVYKENKVPKDCAKNFNLHPNKIVHVDKNLNIYIIHTSFVIKNYMFLIILLIIFKLFVYT